MSPTQRRVAGFLVAGVLGLGAVVLGTNGDDATRGSERRPLGDRETHARVAGRGDLRRANGHASPEAANAEWTDATNARIATAEYAIRPIGADRFRAANRAQGLVARFDADGAVAIAHRGASTSEVKLSFRGVQDAGDATRRDRGAPRQGACRSDRALDERGECLRRLEIDHGEGLVEWWENRAAGLEQGFELASPPVRRAGVDHLELAIDVVGARVVLRGDGEGADGTARDAALVPDHGGALAYSALRAHDRDGTELRAWLDTDGAGDLVIHVDERAARYPIAIDPIITASASFIADSDQVDAAFGTSVANAGDVNGDGYGDVVVGAPDFDAGQTDEGRVFVYLGGPNGLGATAIVTKESDQAGAHFGASVASAGDVDGDGLGDIVVGAPDFDSGETDEGAAFVYLGVGSGVGIAATAVFTVDADQASAHLGASVGSAGDVNGDGFSEIVVGAPSYDEGQTDEGQAFVFAGSATGTIALGAWSEGADQAGASAGTSVGFAGDVNGDGFADVIVGAPNFADGQAGEGRVFVYLGSGTGLGTVPWIESSDQIDALLGASVAAAGDVNGDGFADVIVGAPSYTNGHSDEGAAFVYLGSPTGLGADWDWSVEANQVDAAFGTSVALAGDVNGDGYGDVIVGAPAFDAGQVDEGRVFLYLGSGTGLATVAAWTAEADQPSASFGADVGAAGDVNGDGYGDVLVGARGFETGESNEGLAFGYLGGPDVLTTTGAPLEADQAGAEFGASLASAGDVNGDGYGDVIVGAFGFDAGQSDEGRAFLYLGSATGLGTTAVWTAESDQVAARFARSVASAGDVNGDGYDDVIVGAAFFDATHVDEGRAFVYLGGPSGLATTATWSAGSDQASTRFGGSVASAGDVNGDGFADVIVGAEAYANGQTNEGAAFVYFGSSRGLRTTPAWKREPNDANSNFGSSVASAGDVNGDGFGDVIVGARLYDADQTNEGRAFVYLGSATGLAATDSWNAESNQAQAEFGFSVSSAGDVNRDGYGDVIVGALAYDAGQTNEGRAYVYLGSALGLPADPTWTAESDQNDALFGASVASAGDVNGDGYGDVIVGSPAYVDSLAEEGSARVYLGSATGLAASDSFATFGGQTSARLGSVASAGDVNGDGYGDVLVGASSYSAPQAGEGRVLVHFGGGSAGRAPGPRLVMHDGFGGEPIRAGNRLKATSLTVSLDGSSPFGRTNVALEVEVKGNGLPFDGLGTTTSASFVSGSSATGVAAVIPITLAALPTATRFHVRARLRYRASDARPASVSRWILAAPSGSARAVHVRTAVADVDGDGDASFGFGGTDCDDDEVEINTSATDTACDGIDSNCSGAVDEGFVAAVTSCGIGACASNGMTACTNGVFSNACVPGTPASSDATCDGIDDDCSGANDEDFVSTMTTCGVGACASTGVSSCPSGTVASSCLPGMAASSDATCDGIDDDCSGANDEDFTPAATTCGVGACASTGVASCSSGAIVDSCAALSPAPDDTTCDGVDDDCSGASDEDYVSIPTQCGVGACASTGISSCPSGSVASSCVPLAPALADATCDGADDDCSGTSDEDFVGTVTGCGVGACAAAGSTTCSAGALGDSCVPGTPAANDATCNGIDDDCSGFPDEDGMCSAVDAGAPDSGVSSDAGNDASVVDASNHDASDAGPTDVAPAGCGCVIAGAKAGHDGLAAGFGLVVLTIFLGWRRFARRRSHSQHSSEVELT